MKHDKEQDEFDENDSGSNGPEEGHLIEEQGTGSHRRRRKRIKIRKRVRIKRKTSPQKKAKKILQAIAWVVIIAGFIVTIVVLVLQLDLSSKHRNKRSVDAARYAPGMSAAKNQRFT